MKQSLPPQPRRRGFVLPIEWLICLRIVAGWTHLRAAQKAEVSPREWLRWELGECRVQAAAWLLMLRRAGLPETWQPPLALAAWARSVAGHKHDVVALARELGAPAPTGPPSGTPIGLLLLLTNP